ncbi:MAG: IS200/IS605 family transposase [Bacteroidales bacterium]
MSHVNILIHAVWGTHNREPVLIPGKRELLLDHIRQNARSKGIYVDTINAHTDHVHCLISLEADQNIAKVMQLIKGEAACWANKENLFHPKLEWAEDYFAASVSKSALGKVRNYIRKQGEHHQKLTFMQEYANFIEHYNFGQG